MIKEIIQGQLAKHPIVLYMKGTPQFPQCGFSAKVADLLQRCKADFFAVNVLEDDAIRQGIKEYGQWPTIPQLYVRGELVGGCDIVSELFEQGELATLLAEEAHA
jgi:monothiol glutaredoxin